MAGSATLLIKVLVDNAKAAADIDATASKFDKFQSSMGKLAAPAAVVTGALVGMGTVAVNAASELQQSMGAVESVFGSAADTVIAFSENAATAVGLSKSDYQQLAAVAGAAFINMGLSADEAAAQTDQLIGIGADLAATFGGSTTDAVQALQAAFRGEADPAEKFGLNLKASAVNAKLAEMGLDGLTGAAGEAARQQAIMALIMEGTSDVQGQFAAEADTAAGAQAIANAKFEDAAASLGESLLPAVTTVTEKLGEMADWMAENKTLVMVLAGVVGGLALGILAINAALTVYRAVQTVATAVQWASNAAWLASPITWVVVGILAIVAGIILLWQKSEGFRNVVIGIWNAIKNAAKTAWNAIKTAISAVISWAKGFITSAGNVIKNVWNAIKSAATSVWNGIKSVVNNVVGWIKSFINVAGNTIKLVWMNIKRTADNVWNGIKSVVNNVINGIKNVINGVKTTFTNVFNSAKSVATSALNAILSPVRAIKSAFDSVVSAVKNVISWIGNIKMPSLPDWLPFGLGADAAAAPMFAPAAGLSPLAAGARGRNLVDAFNGLSVPTGGGSLTVINVRGTLNDTDSARAVRRVLRRDSRRRSGVVIGAAV